MCKLKANCRLFSRLFMVWLDGSLQLFHFSFSVASLDLGKERETKKGLMICTNKVSQLMNNDESRGRLPPLPRCVCVYVYVCVAHYLVCFNKHNPAVLSLWQQESDSSQNGFLTERWKIKFSFLEGP